MEHLLEYTPTPVVFQIVPGTQTHTYLTLRNLTSDSVAYKVKTTNVKRYCVRPNAAILPPADSIQIEIVQQAIKTPPTDLSDCRDRFQLQAVALNEHTPYHDGDDVNQIWANAPVTRIRKAKFGVRMQLKQGHSWMIRGESGKLADAITSIDDEVQLVPTASPHVQDSQPVVTFINTPKTSADSVVKTVSTIPESNLPSVVSVSTVDPPSIQKIPSAMASIVSPSVDSSASVPAPVPPPQVQTPQKTTSEHPSTEQHQPAPQKVPQRAPPPLPVQVASDVTTQVSAPSPPPAPSVPSVPSVSAVPPVSAPVAPTVPPASTATTAASSTQPSTSASSSAAAKPASLSDTDYVSAKYQRTRALNVRPAPKVELPPPTTPERQRVAVERAGELARQINERQAEIDALQQELAEARHKLSDARMATRPAYDVRYEVNENARVPFAQICIMAIISGALLQLLV